MSLKNIDKKKALETIKELHDQGYSFLVCQNCNIWADDRYQVVKKDVEDSLMWWGRKDDDPKECAVYCSIPCPYELEHEVMIQDRTEEFRQIRECLEDAQ